MRKHNLTSTPLHLKTAGGEMKTSILEGALIGIVIGSILGFAIFMVADQNLTTSITTLTETSQNSMLYFGVIFLLSVLFFGFAGALVGIGVPRFNPYPHQGRIKKWKALSLKALKPNANDVIVYVPEEKREMT